MVGQVFSFLLFVMPRGWSKGPVLDGWVQIIRGPRPKSEKWPKAGQQKVLPKRNQSAVSRGHPQLTRQWERDSGLLQRSTSRPPDAAAAEANLEVERLQGAIVALGEVLPVNERVEACKGSLERAKKRLVRTEAVIANAQEQKLIFEAELREGEARLLQLQAESEAQPEGPSVAELQSRIDQLIQERDVLQKSPPKTALPGLWMADGSLPIVQEVPPMPEDRQDLERMVELPQLRASERFRVRGRCHGGQSGSSGSSRVCEDGCIRARCPHERAGEIFCDVCSDRSGRRREEVHRGNTDGGESGLRNSRYGLRGVRLGEASNPGPPGRRVRDSAEEILDSLERELTSIESDDEPLVRAGTGRNVVPRIHAGEPTVVQSDSEATRALQGGPGVKCPTLPLPQSQHCHHFPHGSTGTWMNQVRCSRSHVGARGTMMMKKWKSGVSCLLQQSSTKVVRWTVQMSCQQVLRRKNFPRAVIRLLPQFLLVQGQFDGSFSSVILRMSAALFQSWI